MTDSEKPPRSSRSHKVVRRAWAFAVSVVVMIVLPFVSHPRERVHPRAKEAALKSDLAALRGAIDDYTLGEQKPPTALQDLVDAHYLRSIPIDPTTTQRDWRVEFDDVQVSPGSVVNGIVDIHSASAKTSLDGTPYDTW